MHIEIQVALNFVISYLYNKLPRRRVNIFGEELEKALRDKFQGHWYPEKPYKGSAFRCLKTGDPTDAVLERAARESGVPIADILENLPNELSVWVDPGEVSYRIGEKGAVKILYSENSDNHEDNTSADREVTKTFNPEAQCFRPIDIINTSMNSLSLSPKISPQSGSSPHSTTSTSPTYKGSPCPILGAGASNANGYMQRAAQPLTFTTATFAQTKFGSTKLKTSSKRSNSSTYRMSPTEFSNYIKQRALQQQLHHAHGTTAQQQQQNHFGPIGPVSPARSLSPNPLNSINGLNSHGGSNNDPFYFSNMSSVNGDLYPQFNGQRSIFGGNYQGDSNSAVWSNGSNTPNQSSSNQSKFNSYLEPIVGAGFGGTNGYSLNQSQDQLTSTRTTPTNFSSENNNKNVLNDLIRQNFKDSNNDTKTLHAGNSTTGITVTVSSGSTDNSTETSPMATPIAKSANAQQQQQQQQQDSNSSKLMDGLNSFYTNATGSSYQQLLVAN